MNLNESLEHLEETLGVPNGFCFKLPTEDDWSFVIKLHALIECAVAEQITRAFERKELTDIFSRIELSNPRTGKVAFLKALGLLPEQHIQFVRNLSELRNDLAHKVRNVGINLGDYFRNKTADYSPKQLREFANRWAFGIKVKDQKNVGDLVTRFQLPVEGKVTHKDTDIPANIVFDRAQFLLVWPKVAIWWTALGVLDAISLCNQFGPLFWHFDMYEADEKQMWFARAYALFAKAKVGDPDYVERKVREIERLNPDLRVKRDEDGQPNLESLASCLCMEFMRRLANED